MANQYPPQRFVVLTCLVTALSYLGARLGGALIVRPEMVSPLWLGNVLLASLLLLVPRRIWPVLLAAGLAGFFLYDLQAGGPMRSIVWLVLSNAVEVLTAVLCLSSSFDGVPRLDSVKALAKYSFYAVFLAPFAGAFFGALSTSSHYWASWKVAFFSEALGFLTLMPAILGWAREIPTWEQKPRAFYLEAAALIGGVVLLSYMVFGAPGHSSSPALLYSLLPFLLWSALRFGTMGISTSMVAIAFVSIWGAVHGRGPFTGAGPLHNVLSLQLFLFFAATPFIVLAVLVEERKQAEVVVREGQSRLAAIVTSAMDAIITIDNEQRIVLFNTSAEHMFNRPAHEVIGTSIEHFIPKRFRGEHCEHIRRFGEADVTNRGMGNLGALWAQRENGEEFPIEASISHTEAGGKKLFTVIMRDISERRRAEQAIRESEQRFRLVANTAPVLIWMSGTDKLCTYFNKPWLDFTGRSIEAELGNGWAEGVHPEDLGRCMDTYAQAFNRREEFRMEYRLRRNDGEYRWVSDKGVPRFNAERSFAGYIGSCIDVTDHKLAEEALSSVSRKLIEAQEKERTRIARELHDDFGQRLALLTIELEMLQQNSPDLSAEVRGRMGELRKQTSEIATDIQSLSHELHSSRLEYVGIAVAMRGLCQEFAERQKVEIDFKTHGLPIHVPPDISLCLFRVLQEALHNAAKHSGVLHFEVRLWGTSNEVHLTVSDSGAGFDREAAKQSRGLGLISMEERLKHLNGTFSIESVPKRGTTMHAHVPLRLGSDSMRVVG